MERISSIRRPVRTIVGCGHLQVEARALCCSNDGCVRETIVYAAWMIGSASCDIIMSSRARASVPSGGHAGAVRLLSTLARLVARVAPAVAQWHVRDR